MTLRNSLSPLVRKVWARSPMLPTKRPLKVSAVRAAVVLLLVSAVCISLFNFVAYNPSALHEFEDFANPIVERAYVLSHSLEGLVHPLTEAASDYGSKTAQLDEQETWRQERVELLHKLYAIPRIFLENMSVTMLQRLTRQCEERKYEMMANGAGKDAKPRLLIVHAQNGLGNRMRVVAGGMAWARANGPRVVVVVWEKDVHMQADFLDLFDDANDLVVVNGLNEVWPFTRAREQDVSWSTVDLYNYMETETMSNKGALVVNNMGKHIYFRACELITTESVKEMQRESARSLKQLKPVPAVANLLFAIERENGVLSKKIGVHIRQKSIKSEFSESFDAETEYGKDSVDKMDYWRSKSSVETFIPEMREQLKRDPQATFFVGSDTPEVFFRLRAEFPGKISHLSLASAKDCENSRSLKCTQIALADLLALARTRLFLGSNFSSFTSMIVKLGVKAYRRVGIEFALD
eukprot:CAMPEP_0198319558 /NCGR_PEP_ID=MMETSP1450-20131203/8665_1 /TAXON_ID=753684 ORGANISM="Madagascaria erythrocladiodes, Strain CCMP3234" /NCGR_SAMPLE_ID=MMETSP1450 /ASSEMBLY_ACC=CAM_ASM_001115 /LENGTH=464 /DNA_ID=CAMNT_0044022943 /DNA_START=126 /DNA_END=1520 /DNA_ORIENTATION=-